MSDISSDVVAWCARFADALGTTAPSVDEIETLLDLAGIAAHASQRQAAPVACWLAAKAGVAPTAARDLAAGF